MHEDKYVFAANLIGNIDRLCLGEDGFDALPRRLNIVVAFPGEVGVEPQLQTAADLTRQNSKVVVVIQIK